MMSIPVNNSLVTIVTLIFVSGLIVGLIIIGSEFANPFQAITDAKYDNQLMTARTLAEKEKLQEDTRHLKELNAQELQEKRDRAALVNDLLQTAVYTLIGTIALAALALAVGGSVHIARSAIVPQAGKVEERLAERKRLLYERERLLNERENLLNEREKRLRESALTDTAGLHSTHTGPNGQGGMQATSSSEQSRIPR